LTKAALHESIEALRRHRAEGGPKDMRAAFGADPGRFGAYSLSFDDLLLDWSKCAVDARTMALLEQAAAAVDLEGKRAAMFAGEPINLTEGRAVLHVALRGAAAGIADGRSNVAGDVNAVLDAVCAFADSIRSGRT
jgi:glucose-6-phosphate isomerase